MDKEKEEVNLTRNVYEEDFPVKYSRNVSIHSLAFQSNTAEMSVPIAYDHFVVPYFQQGYMFILVYISISTYFRVV